MTDNVEKGDVSQAAEPAPAAEPAQPETEAGLEAQLAEARAQANDYLDQLRRVAADFSNYRKRVEREREEMSRFSNVLLLGKLLPILDDFDRAMATLPADLRRFTWVEGISLIERKLWLTMEGEGLKPIEAAGQPFDPARHEAVIREETTAHPDGQVVAELQRGYELHGRVLRPALVKVAVAPAGAADEGTKGIEGTEGIGGTGTEGTDGAGEPLES